MCNVNFKAENSNDESNKKRQNKNGCGGQDKSNETSFTKTQKHEKR